MTGTASTKSSHHHEQRGTWGPRNAGTGRCRVPIVEEGECRGQVFRQPGLYEAFIGLYALTAVDGTAAGDAFRAARACAAGAIAASRPGAQPSLPTAAELEEILAR